MYSSTCSLSGRSVLSATEHPDPQTLIGSLGLLCDEKLDILHQKISLHSMFRNQKRSREEVVRDSWEMKEGNRRRSEDRHKRERRLSPVDAELAMENCTLAPTSPKSAKVKIP